MVELQDQAGLRIPGYGLEDCQDIFGDKIEGIAAWTGGDDVGALSGKPTRLHVKFPDAHLYAFQFRP
jgi:hypothetical protein